MTFECQFPEGIDVQKFLRFYAPFLRKDHIDNPAFIFSTLDLVPDFDRDNLLETFSNDLGDVSVYQSGDSYVMTFGYNETGNVHYMVSDKLFTTIRVYIHWDGLYGPTALTSMLRVAFSQNILLHDGVSIHSSVISNNGYGYLFLGKSGTGKSTHTRLWLQNIDGSTLLNDDNPILRFEGDKLYVYGSPWSGKTHCYKNERAVVKSIVRLEQAPVNEFSKLSGVFAWTELFPSCAILKHCTDLYQIGIGLVNKIVSSVCIGHMKCLPNAEAAKICALKVGQFAD